VLFLRQLHSPANMQPCLVIGHHQKYCSFPSQAKFLFMVVIAAQIKFLILGYVEVD